MTADWTKSCLRPWPWLTLAIVGFATVLSIAHPTLVAAQGLIPTAGEMVLEVRKGQLLIC